MDKSLVRQQVLMAGEPRFNMLETIREFGLEQLEASGEAMTTQRRHAQYYLVLVEAALHGWSILTGHRRLLVERIGPDRENLRMALNWSLSEAKAGDVEIGVGLEAAFWYFRQVGSIREGRERLGNFLVAARLRSASAETLAKGTLAAGSLALFHGDYVQCPWKMRLLML